MCRCKQGTERSESKRSGDTIGDNVRDLRGSISQQTLADRMRARGWSWTQTTVWSLEVGKRPLRLSEAQDLAAVLDVSLDRLLAE